MQLLLRASGRAAAGQQLLRRSMCSPFSTPGAPITHLHLQACSLTSRSQGSGQRLARQFVLPRHTAAVLKASPRLLSTTATPRCAAILPSSIMADRDILSTAVKPSHYNLSISGLKQDDWSFQGKVV